MLLWLGLITMHLGHVNFAGGPFYFAIFIWYVWKFLNLCFSLVIFNKSVIWQRRPLFQNYLRTESSSCVVFLDQHDKVTWAADRRQRPSVLNDNLLSAACSCFGNHKLLAVIEIAMSSERRNVAAVTCTDWYRQKKSGPCALLPHHDEDLQ